MIKLAVSGAHGRMGQRITALAVADPAIEVVALVEHPDHPKVKDLVEGIPVQTDNNAFEGCDVIIEFTLPDGTMNNLNVAAMHGVPIVIGTTGFSDAQLDELKKLSQKIPILWSTNMSVGVNLLWMLIDKTAAITGTNYRINVEETHHVHKKDAPSGTAKTMIEIAEASAGKKIDDVKSLREGEVIGDHSIVFESDVDVIRISHSAKTRDIFAQGALRAAKWLVGKEPGLYHMHDVLGLS